MYASSTPALRHRSSSMVATGVADRVPERIRHLVYLDAFAPRNGQSVFDLVGPEERARRLEIAKTLGAGWKLPPNPPPDDTSEEDLA